MTTIGVLGPSTRQLDVDLLNGWADVVWGVDTVAEAVNRISISAIDVLVTEASVVYLTEEIVRLPPEAVGTICAIAESDGVFTWAQGRPRVTAVRDVGDVRSIILTSTSPASPPDASPVTLPTIAPRITVASVQPREDVPVAPETLARVIAVWGPVGSPGVTTTAISLATVCAQAGHSVMLCDADTRGASIAVALGLFDETPGFAAACRLAGRGELSAEQIRRVAVEVDRYGATFSVLTGLPRASRWAEVVPHKAKAVIELLTTMFDVVIIDTGFGVEENDWIEDAPQRDGGTRAFLRSADSVVAVGSADPVGMARIIRGLDEIRDLCPNPVLVINRVNRGDAGEVRDVIHRFTDHRVRVSIAADTRGGVEDALERARSQATVWRELASLAGLAMPTSRKVWWRR